MIKTMNPRYKLPGRKYFSTVAIPRLYTDTVEKEKKELSRVNSFDVAITVDCWTSVAGTPFMAVTAHYISEDWKLVNVCLSCKHFSEDHTSENVIEMLTNTLLEWNIDIKTLSCVITDNGSNMLKAVMQLELKHISCLAHNINIGINRAFNLPQVKGTCYATKENSKFYFSWMEDEKRPSKSTRTVKYDH